MTERLNLAKDIGEDLIYRDIISVKEKNYNLVTGELRVGHSLITPDGSVYLLVGREKEVSGSDGVRDGWIKPESQGQYMYFIVAPDGKGRVSYANDIPGAENLLGKAAHVNISVSSSTCSEQIQGTKLFDRFPSEPGIYRGYTSGGRNPSLNEYLIVSEKCRAYLKFRKEEDPYIEPLHYSAWTSWKFGKLPDKVRFFATL